MVHMSLLESRDRNVQNKIITKSSHREQYDLFFRKKVLRGPLVCSEFYLILLGDWFGLFFKTQFWNIQMSWHYVSNFSIEAYCSINNQSINQALQAVAIETVESEEVTNMASRPATVLYLTSREPLHRIQSDLFQRVKGTLHNTRAQKQFRLATVGNEGVWFNTGSIWRFI